MNILQLQNNLDYLLNEIQNKSQHEIKIESLRFIHQYSIYFIGNKNYLQDYRENKITLFGVLDQLIKDFCNTITIQYGHAAPVAAPAPAPAPGTRIELSTVKELCSDLSKIVYGV